MFGSKYKRDHNVSFPPFSVFVDFVRTEAKAHTYPSFNFLTSQTPSVRREWKDRHDRMPVSVQKTTVSPPMESASKTKIVDHNKLCPIHEKPHPLKKCCCFREKTLEERKQFLKEHSICFKCCSATDHFAKDCKVEVHCKECHSNHHLSALHPGPAPWIAQSPPPPSDHGGEEDGDNNQEITSKCTEVCGEGVSARACSKICLVSVYPKGRRDMVKRIYAILDEQSNRSLARTEFFDLFNIQSGKFPYILRTCAGLKETSGRRACGYVIESVDQKTTLSLPTLIECNQIPNNRSEIPTPNAAHHLESSKEDST